MTHATPCDPQVRQGDLERLFVGRLSGRREARLRAHLSRCAPCRREHDRLIHLERALASGGLADALDVPSHFEMERVEARLCARSRPGAGPAAWIAAAVAVAGGVLLAVGPTGDAERPGTFRPKGPAVPAMPDVALRAFTGEAGPDGRPQVRPLADGDTVVAGTPLTFSTFHADPALGAVAVVGVDRAGAAVWFGGAARDAPDPADAPDAAAAGRRDVPIGRTWRVPATAGDLAIYGIFAAAPPDRAAVEAWVSAGAKGAPPVAGGRVARVALSVVPR